MSSPVNPPRDERDRPTETRNAVPGSAPYRPATSTAGTTGAAATTDSRELVRQQRERFGGMKFGACFFGWLTATGAAVILTALLAAVGVGIGLSTGVTPAQPGASAPTIGIATAVVLLVVVLVAYVCGGYVAGRMARFNGVRQGVGVWLWAIVVAVVVAVLGLVAGNQFNVLSRLNGLPSLPVSGSTATTGAVISIVVVAVVALIGAILGGLAGMRYHRRIDHATFIDED